jgi:hypothetical protein
VVRWTLLQKFVCRTSVSERATFNKLLRNETYLILALESKIISYGLVREAKQSKATDPPSARIDPNTDYGHSFLLKHLPARDLSCLAAIFPTPTENYFRPPFVHQHCFARDPDVYSSPIGSFALAPLSSAMALMVHAACVVFASHGHTANVNAELPKGWPASHLLERTCEVGR